jgi:hypothetical protein
MMKPKITTSTGAILLCCALVGGAVAVLEGTASASRVSAHTASRLPTIHGPWPRRDVSGAPLHAVSVVPNQADSGFVTLTIDDGQITRVGGGTISLREGTKQLTYATPSLTIPSSSKITLDGKEVSLEKLAVGDSAFVSSSPEGTTVSAWDGSVTSGAWSAGAHAWSGHEHGVPYPGHSWAGPGDGPPDGPAEGSDAW